MPEGPEVKRIGMGLAKAVSGKTLIEANLVSGRYTKKSPSGWQQLIDSFPLRVIGAGVHGKFIYWLCDNETFIYSTLGMTGAWQSKRKKHTRVEFKFTDGSNVYYNDQRNFGTLKIVKGKQNLIDKLTSMGPDMLAEDVSDEKFITCLRKKPNWGITKALMDQSIVCGVGNYIKSDSLWHAKINPHNLVSDLSDGQLAVLNRSIKEIIRESFDSGGATIRTYSGFDDEDGNYGRRFLVYQQDTDPEGNDVIREETADGRTTHWVKEVQK
jgi:formamidopyrimidine-DNA glycosylase